MPCNKGPGGAGLQQSPTSALYIGLCAKDEKLLVGWLRIDWPTHECKPSTSPCNTNVNGEWSYQLHISGACLIFFGLGFNGEPERKSGGGGGEMNPKHELS